MDLKDTVSLFSTEDFADVFALDITFKGRINPFSEVANSGLSAQRRILETPTTEIIPTGRVILAPSGKKFIIAAPNYDYWNGEVIRYKYPILPVDTMGAVGTIGETLTDTQPDLEVYAYPYFVRRIVDLEERSDYLSGYEISFSSVKSFVRSDILTIGSKVYRFKTDTWLDGAGFSVAQATMLESPVQILDVVSGKTEYDPATDTHPGTTTPSVSCFVEPLKQDYEFVTPSFVDIGEGDKAISVMKADVTAAVNDQIGDYRVLSIRDSGTWVTCQCRRGS